MIKIEAAGMKDAESCWKISNTRELFGPNGDVVPKYWFEEIIREKQILLLAKEGNKIVGYIMGERLAGNFAIAHLLSVVPEYRRRGIGDMLSDAFEKECRHRGLKGIVAYAYRNGAGIKKLLEKRGYTIGSEMLECLKIFD